MRNLFEHPITDEETLHAISDAIDYEKLLLSHEDAPVGGITVLALQRAHDIVRTYIAENTKAPKEDEVPKVPGLCLTGDQETLAANIYEVTGLTDLRNRLRKRIIDANAGVASAYDVMQLADVVASVVDAMVEMHERLDRRISGYTP
jgi:hypothetical protein